MKRTLIILVVGLMTMGCLTPEQKALRDSVIGEYEWEDELGHFQKFVLLENGIVEAYENGKKEEEESKWKIVEAEIHVTEPDGDIAVLRMNKDGSITYIADISTGEDIRAAIQDGKWQKHIRDDPKISIHKDGLRVDYPKEEQETFKKIK